MAIALVIPSGLLSEDTTAGGVEFTIVVTANVATTALGVSGVATIVTGTLANDIAFVFDDAYGRCNKFLHICQYILQIIISGYLFCLLRALLCNKLLAILNQYTGGAASNTLTHDVVNRLVPIDAASVERVLYCSRNLRLLNGK